MRWERRPATDHPCPTEFSLSLPPRVCKGSERSDPAFHVLPSLRGRRHRRRATTRPIDPGARPRSSEPWTARPEESPRPPGTSTPRAWLLVLLRTEQPVHLAVGGYEFAQHSARLSGVAGAESFDRDFGAGLDDVGLVTVADHST